MALFRLGEQLVHDVRYGVRAMAASPVFSAMAILSLALGIGANTAIYSFMDAILMRALPVQHPESLVVINWRSRDFPAVVHNLSGSTFKDPTGFTSGNFPFKVYELMHASDTVFSSLFAFNGAGRLNALIPSTMQPADLAAGQYVSGEFFSGLGVSPAAGRLIVPADDRAGAEAVVVLAFGYAQRHFGDITHAIGQSVLLNNTPFTVAGVAAPEFFGVNPGGPQDIYLPMHASLLLEAIRGSDSGRKYIDNTSYWVQMMGRLRPDVTRARAEAVIAPIFRRFVESTAATDKERADLPSLSLQDGAGGLDFLRRQYSKPLYVLMSMVALILAIACANIANLLLARATARRREMAVRLSLGAGRLRVIRQLLTESVLLACAGGLLGVAFAGWGVRALTLLIGNGRDNFTLRADLNWHVLVVTTALSVGTGIVFGLAPAVRLTYVDLTLALRQASAGGERRRLQSCRGVRVNQVLVVGQIALSVLLLVAAGLFVRTLANLNAISLGFNSEHVLLLSVNARQVGYRNDELVRFYEGLQARLSAIPGVRNVTSSSYALVSGAVSTTLVKIPGFTGSNRDASVLSVGPGFFTTMQTQILLGREVDEHDVRSGARVAAVNEVFAHKYFGNENPVGRHFTLSDSTPADLEIVGVSKNARYNSLKGDIPAVAYVPYSQDMRYLNQMVYELRAAGDPLTLAAVARQVVRQADSRVPVSNLVTQARQIDQTISQERTFATLCTTFALLAVTIASVGLYGLMAYSVARRTGEIGIRMALGAGRPRVISMVLREVLAMAGVGIGLGLGAAVVASRLVESFLFRIKPNDPMTLSLAVGTLLAASMAAAYGPAWQASRIDPWTALRTE